MEPIYSHEFLINDAYVDCFGRLKPSMLLFLCQEIAGQHCNILGADFDTLAQKNLIWAIIRQKVQITRLPRSGETIRVETWPMPTTKVCYPRSTVAYDAEGNELFRSIGMWVLMDASSRAMILPGKSGVTVQGMLTGTELATPGSLASFTFTADAIRRHGAVLFRTAFFFPRCNKKLLRLPCLGLDDLLRLLQLEHQPAGRYGGYSVQPA